MTSKYLLCIALLFGLGLAPLASAGTSVVEPPAQVVTPPGDVVTPPDSMVTSGSDINGSDIKKDSDIKTTPDQVDPPVQSMPDNVVR